MSDNYSWGRVAPSSANPEVAVNDALSAADATVHGVEIRVAALEDLSGGGGEEPVTELPAGGTEGQILAVHIDNGVRTLLWINPPTGGGGATYPTGGTVGQVLKIVSLNPLVVGWAADNVGSGGGGGGGGTASYIKGQVSFTVDPSTKAITIRNSFNVAGVVRTADGKYNVTWTTPISANLMPLVTGRYPDMPGTAPAGVVGGANRETASGDTSGATNIEVYFGQYDVYDCNVVMVDPVEWQQAGGGSAGSASYPSGGSVGQVLKIKSLSPLVVEWKDDIVGEGSSGGGGTTPEVTFPRVANLTDTSVYGRGSSATPLTMTDTLTGATFQDKSADNNGFKTILRPLPFVPSAQAVFEFGGKITYLSGTSQYNIEGLVLTDAAGNTQVWGINGGGSGRENRGNASFVNGGNWQDADYDVGNSTQGQYFKMGCDGTNMFLYRSVDGKDWGTPIRTYALSSGRINIPTRYGFIVHRYSSGTGDTLVVGEAFSNEYPKAAPPPRATYGAHKYWRVLCMPGSGFYAHCFREVNFFDSAGAPIPTTGSDGAAFNRPGAANAAYKAFDGDPATYSEDASASVSTNGIVVGVTHIGFQFNVAKEVSYLSVSARSDSGGDGAKQIPEQMVLQYSDDGKAYVTAFGFGGPDFAVGETRTFIPAIP